MEIFCKIILHVLLGFRSGDYSASHKANPAGDCRRTQKYNTKLFLPNTHFWCVCVKNLTTKISSYDIGAPSH